MSINNVINDSKTNNSGALQPALVESFEVVGLYGYRTLSFKSRYAAAILIAKNGAGKTTLLGALNVFLRRQFHRLSEIDFQEIRCKLRGVETLLVLKKSDLSGMINNELEDEVKSLASASNMHTSDLLDFILGDYPYIRKRTFELNENEVFRKVLRLTSYDRSEARKVLDRISSLSESRSENLKEIAEAIESAVGDLEIVYLPTYRRVELPLVEDKDDETRAYQKRSTPSSRLAFSRKGIFSANINFGLSDIAARLFALNQQIQARSNNGYRKISANIINELLDGTFERSASSSQDRPDRDSLTLFFSRMKEPSAGFPRYAYESVVIPDIDQIYGEGASSPDVNKFLQYFLGKLNAVILETKDIELLVEEFVINCNRYLTENVDGLSEEDRLTDRGSDEKILVLDRQNLNVKVISAITHRAIPLDALSSGEKQMISLFAYLYLYPGSKIILIDEPELSLAIDWQRKILTDIIGAPSCAQMIAITHSPFVFDNSLEPFAAPLQIEIGNVGVEADEDESLE